MSLVSLERAVTRARAKMEQASARRRALPPGSSRARVTTANARWATACEAHDRALAALNEAREIAERLAEFERRVGSNPKSAGYLP